MLIQPDTELREPTEREQRCIDDFLENFRKVVPDLDQKELNFITGADMTDPLNQYTVISFKRGISESVVSGTKGYHHEH